MSLVLRPRRQSHQGGFTLIEVMIALLLLLIGVAGVLSMQMTSVKATSFSRHATEATIVAEDKMEELTNMSAVALVAGGNGTDQVDSQGQASGTGIYTRRWTIQDGAFDPNIKSVRVEVDWDERGTTTKTIVIETQRRP